MEVSDLDMVDAAMVEGKTRVLYLESMSNPTLTVANILELEEEPEIELEEAAAKERKSSDLVVGRRIFSAELFDGIPARPSHRVATSAQPPRRGKSRQIWW